MKHKIQVRILAAVLATFIAVMVAMPFVFNWLTKMMFCDLHPNIAMCVQR